jgi:hypothetical protein
MRWGSWLLIVFGITFMAIGVWAWTTAPSNANNGMLVQPMFIGGSILLAAGIALRACMWGCCDWSDCDCDHCGDCSGGNCCGNCACSGDEKGHEGHEGHEGHSH